MAEKGCKVQNPVSVSEIFTFSKQKFSKNYSFKGESHDFYEAVCVLKGTVGVTSGKKVYLLSKGQMTVHRENSTQYGNIHRVNRYRSFSPFPPRHFPNSVITFSISQTICNGRSPDFTTG